MSQPGIAVFGYGLLLSPEQLDTVPWQEKPWEWNFKGWVLDNRIFEEDSVPQFSMFTAIYQESVSDKTSALISAKKWFHTLLYSWENPVILSEVNLCIEPSPGFELFVQEFLPTVEYNPKWYLIASRG